MHVLDTLSLQYPEPQLVGLPVIDERFRTTHVHIHRAVDLREDYMFALTHFKESCGRGPQALLDECIVLLAARAKGSNLTLFLHVIGEVCTKCEKEMWFVCGRRR